MTPSQTTARARDFRDNFTSYVGTLTHVSPALRTQMLNVVNESLRGTSRAGAPFRILDGMHGELSDYDRENKTIYTVLVNMDDNGRTFIVTYTKELVNMRGGDFEVISKRSVQYAHTDRSNPKYPFDMDAILYEVDGKEVFRINI